MDVIYGVCKSHPEAHFKLLGVGYYSPDLDCLQQKIKRLNLTEHIDLLPWLSHEETLEYVSNSLFYLTVARYEGLPLAVIEAMSLGKAVVASSVTGNVDCVSDGINGRLLPLEVSAFVDAICDLLDNPSQCALFGNNSRRLFEESFLISNRIHELERIYENEGKKRKKKLRL